jgi:ATP-dependent DNA helicase RecG
MIFQESENVELKEMVVPDLVKEVVAFANTQEGIIYIGVKNDGEPVGVDNTDKVILQIKNMIRDSIKPDVTMFVRFDSFIENGKHIVSVSVQKGSDRPYYLASKGLKPSGVYVRNGTAADPSTDTAIRRMIKETDGDSFESMRSLEQQLTFQSAKDEFRRHSVEFGNRQMKSLGLINPDGIYTNIALLISGQCVHTVKAAVFPGTDQTEFKDRREFDGSLFKQMEDVYSYIEIHNQTHSTFDKLRRIDARDYPETALREALLNSLVHRDYSFSASTLISIYDDRIEFVSIGGLLSGISEKDILLGLSVCRNPKLAAVFYRLRLIEAYGTGITKIMNAYKDRTKKPRIEVSDNAFKITLPNLNYHENHTESLQSEYADSTEAMILAYIGKNEYITRAIAENLLGISPSTANRLLRELVKRNTLIITGTGRQTKYMLK